MIISEITTNTDASESVDIYHVDVSGGAVTVTLPESPSEGATWHVKKIDNSGEQLTVETTGTPTIDGSANVFTVTQYDGWTITFYNGEYYLRNTI